MKWYKWVMTPILPAEARIVAWILIGLIGLGMIVEFKMQSRPDLIEWTPEL
jgi:hypothetical protein